MANSVCLRIVLCGFYSLFHVHTVKEAAVAHFAFLGIEGGFGNVAALDDRDYREIEFLCKGVVAAVMSRHSHNGTCTIARKHILAHPYRDLFSR